MKADELEKMQYPIGFFTPPEKISGEQLSTWIGELETLPQKVRSLVENLTAEELEQPYRPGGWTLRQLIHHIADSHHNSYVRFKWALTEDTPVIKPYDEKAWSELADAKTSGIDLSLDHLAVVHAKLVRLLRGLTEAEMQRTFIHPDTNKESSIAENIGRYAWHGNHHLAHIKNAL